MENKTEEIKLSNKALNKIKEIEKMQKKCLRTASLIKENKFDCEDPLNTTNAKDFHLGISIETPQTKAILMEKWIAKKYNGERIDSSLDKGDLTVPGFEKNIEVKSSFTNKSKSVNIKQIRPYQDVDYFVVFTDEDNYENNRAFYLTKEQMTKELENVKSFAHGTKESVKDNQVYEKNISFRLNSETDKEWQKKYSCQKLKELVYES